ncbi:hypothetical protein Ndes2437A_g03114 [Nannochloris sp. 'desiccata']
MRPVSTLLPSVQFSTTSLSTFKRARSYSSLPRLINKNTFIASAPWNKRSPTLHSTRAASSFTAGDIVTDVGIMVEGEPKNLSDAEVEALCASLYTDSKAVVQQAAMVLVEGEARDSPPGPLELSLVLCDDSHIRDLNKEWRGKDAPTDVLSFEMGEGYDDDADEEERMAFDDYNITSTSSRSGNNSAGEEVQESEPSYTVHSEEDDEQEEDASPVTLLGDVVISLDTAARQAKERNHSLHDECRILLVHGVLHLLGYDHENGGAEADEMAEAEAKIIKVLGWKGDGLIASAEPGGTTAASSSSKMKPSSPKPKRTSDIRLLALDMDGTLLDSRSQVLPSSVSAIKAALAAGVKVMLATGKARPAAMAAMQKVELVGDGLVVGLNNPGLFLQGLAVHGLNGDLIGGGCLTSDIVAAAFQYSLNTGTPICGFLGDECVTIGSMTPEIEELHMRYYEPLADVAPSVDAVLAACGGIAGSLGTGAQSSSGISNTIYPTHMRKLLFMTSSDIVESTLKPHWDTHLLQTDAATMQAVPEMLEIVPRGWNKFVGLQQLLRHAALPVDAVMAIGDGGNDFELVQGVGVGVAMGNAVPEVKKVAVEVVASNDDGGIAEAIEKYIL